MRTYFLFTMKFGRNEGEDKSNKQKKTCFTIVDLGFFYWFLNYPGYLLPIQGLWPPPGHHEIRKGKGGSLTSCEDVWKWTKSIDKIIDIDLFGAKIVCFWTIFIVLSNWLQFVIHNFSGLVDKYVTNFVFRTNKKYWYDPYSIHKKRIGNRLILAFEWRACSFITD